MANEEQLSILKQGVEVWNKWADKNGGINVDLSNADLSGANLMGVDLNNATLKRVNLKAANLAAANLGTADLRGANLNSTVLSGANLSLAHLSEADLGRADLRGINLNKAILRRANLSKAVVFDVVFGSLDLSETLGLEDVNHVGPSIIGTDTFVLSKGKIPAEFLRGCGLSDWEIEETKLYNPDLSNEEINKTLYKIYDLRATQAIQISPLFISYSHADSAFINKIEGRLNKKGVRFWRDIHDLKSGRIETQIDRAISQNRTVLLILSENSIKSDWVEHEVRTARGVEKEIGRDILCPIALDNSWKSSPWPKRVMEQIMEYNILDFSAWQDDAKFEGIFRKLIDGLELFYKDKSHGE